MATPYENNGNDFDNIFEPLGSASKASNVGYAINGTDISNRYYPLSLGGTAVTGLDYESNGTNLGNIFAGLGTVVEIDTSAWDGKSFEGRAGELDSNDEYTASVSLNFQTDGIMQVIETNQTPPGGISEEFIEYLPSGTNTSEYEILIESSDPTATNDAEVWTTISNTITVRHRFTGTSPNFSTNIITISMRKIGGGTVSGTCTLTASITS